MKQRGNTPPMGLKAGAARMLRDHVDHCLNGLLADARTIVGEDVEREFVDAVRRWAARREEEMFPSHKPGSNGARP